MATVSERSREVADKMSHSLCADREERQQRNAKVIEQALLAERRLARLEDAEIADKCDYHSTDACECWRIAKSIRAAAEKEVGK